MGASLSAPEVERFALGELPESCIALIMSKLDPPEICQLARLNNAFRRASTADLVWISKLPSNNEFLARKLFDEMSLPVNKIQLYASLCTPIRFDGGSKEVWLEKRSGKLCMSLSWKGLTITGIHDRRYWTHISSQESRFNTFAYLRHTWWLEIRGELDFSFPKGSYSLFFRLRVGKTTRGILGRRVCNLDQVHGWDKKPVRFQLSTSHGQNATSQCYLGESGNWICYHVGDFVVGGSDKLMKIKFSMTQIDCTHTKAGLCFDSVFIYPTELNPKLMDACNEQAYMCRAAPNQLSFEEL